MPTPAAASIVDSIKSLEPLPEVGMKVLELSVQEDLVPRELIAVIQTDAGITAKVLKLCNSALFGFQREIGSIVEAGNLLGTGALVNLVMTSCTGRYFRDYGAGAETARRRWESSVSNALAASIIAGWVADVDKSRAYTAGLLENVGHLVVDRFMPEFGDAIQGEMDQGSARLDAEASVLGMSHAEIGGRLAEKWGFPEFLVDAIRNHHTPDRSAVDPKLASVGHLGEAVTSKLEMGEGLEVLAYELKGAALGICGLDQRHFAKLEEAVEQEMQKAREIADIT